MRLKLARRGSLLLDGLDNVKTLDYLAEDDVLAVEPRSDDGGDEELGTIGVGTGIGHGKESRSSMLELEVLVGKLCAVDGFASGSISCGEIASLEHEVRDDSVEAAARVTEAMLSSGELSEILGGLWDDAGKGVGAGCQCECRSWDGRRWYGDSLIVELENDAAQRGAVLGDVEEDVGHVEC